MRCYRRGSWPRAGLLLEFGCLLTIAVVLPVPQQALGVLYAAVLFRSTYGSLRHVLGYAGLAILAFLLAVLSAPQPQWHAQLVELAGQLPGLPVVGTLVHFLSRTVRQHQRALSGLERAVARERVLSRAGTALARASDRRAVHSATVAAAGALLEEVGSVEASVTLELGARFDHLAGDADAFGWHAGLRVPADAGYCRALLNGRIAQVVPDTGANRFTAALPITASAGIGSYLGVPLTLPDGQVYGALCAVSHSPRPDLDPRDAAFLKVLAGVVAEQLHALDERARSMSRRAQLQPLCSGQGLVVVAQPIRSVGSNRMVGVEALSRFPGLPAFTPAAVFAEAAALGLSVPLELAAIRAALDLLPRLPRDCYLAVNASPVTLADPRLLEVLSAVPAGRVVLELTEHVPVLDYAGLTSALAPLRHRGVRLAVDDAGAGFASLRHTVALDPDIIKLDLDLVRGLHLDLNRQALVGAFTRYAEELGAALVAEGVQTAQELPALRRLGVPYAQGYHLGRPEPLAAPLRWAGDERAAEPVAAAGRALA